MRVLGARPKEVYEGGESELSGDYHPRRCQIRVWMRTAVRKHVTSPRGFINTLCHELVHLPMRRATARRSRRSRYECRSTVSA